MHRLRQLIIIAAVLAMALTTIAAPVSAAGRGKIGVVNGFPGQTIDICINNVELKSGLRYGQSFFRTLPAGAKNLKVYGEDPRTCRGQLLASRAFPLAAGSDWTIVMTKFGPRLVFFDNEDFGTTSAATPASIWFWRNASDISPVTADIDFDAPFPVADEVLLKGEQGVYGISLPPALPVYVAVPSFRYADTATTLGKPDIRYVENLNRYEWILIGTSPANAKLVVLTRPIPPFS